MDKDFVACIEVDVEIVFEEVCEVVFVFVLLIMLFEVVFEFETDLVRVLDEVIVLVGGVVKFLVLVIVDVLNLENVEELVIEGATEWLQLYWDEFDFVKL